MKTQNPQAFPNEETIMHAEIITDYHYYPGMTLRDYFAGQVLAGAIANPNLKHKISTTKVAQNAYSLADAMLEKRKP